MCQKMRKHWTNLITVFQELATSKLQHEKCDKFSKGIKRIKNTLIFMTEMNFCNESRW